MILESSPNVTYVNNTLMSNLVLELSGTTTESTIHPNGIVQIDTHDISSHYQDSFRLYESKGHIYPVTKSGLTLTDECKEVGSERFCTNNVDLAEALSGIIARSDAFPHVYKDSVLHSVSPYFRFMRYRKGGMHFPHYDSDYNYSYPNKHLVTRYSLVMYFTDCQTGEIAFINDNTVHCQDKSDWTRQAKEEEIYLKVKPKSGRIVLFPHHLCHSVLEFDDGENAERAMLRGDLIFSKKVS